MSEGRLYLNLEADVDDVPRVAFFADSFHAVNGVALTSRQFDAFAPRGQLPFLRAHVGPGTSLQADGPLTTLALQPRSSSVPHQAGHVLRRSNIAFSRITQNWRGNPLISLEVIVSLIAATRTYPKGVKVSGKETAQLNLH